MLIKSVIKNAMSLLGFETAGFRVSARFRDPFDVQKRLLAETECPTILDVGAYHGEVAGEYLHRFPRAIIHCLEPFDESFAAVWELAKRRPGITAHKLALAEKEGPVRFCVNEMPATNSRLRRSSVARRYDPVRSGTVREVEVDAVTLDRFCAEIGIDRIDILKMDIQGGELAALRGGEALLTQKRIGVIFTEVMFVPHYEDNPLFHDIARLLFSFGYSLFDLFLVKHGTNGQLCFGDALFISPALRESVVDACPPEP